jgi:hypothetical protein
MLQHRKVFLGNGNAGGVMQVPMALFVWDDGYGISVPKKYNKSIHPSIKWFSEKDDSNGFIFIKSEVGIMLVCVKHLKKGLLAEKHILRHCFMLKN